MGRRPPSRRSNTPRWAGACCSTASSGTPRPIATRCWAPPSSSPAAGTWCGARRRTPRRNTLEAMSRAALARRALLGQHTVGPQLGGESGALEAPGHLVGQVAARGEPVRRAGVVKQAPAPLQHPRQLLVEIQRIEFAGDPEARRVVENRIEIRFRVFLNALRDVAKLQPHGAGVLGGPGAVRRPGVETTEPQHVLVLLIAVQLRGLALKAPGREIAEPAAGVEDAFAARFDQADLVLRVRVGRNAR